MGHVRESFRSGAARSAARARAPSDTCAIRLRAKFRSANASRFSSPASTGRSPFVTTATCRSPREERQKLESEGAIFSSTSDTEVVLHGVARSRAASVVEAIPEVLRETEGAFSMLFLTPKELIAIRDPRGFRPLALGRLDDAWVVASETCAFDLIDAKYVRDVEPGEMIVINEDGLRSSHPLCRNKHSMCIFEHVYFARPDSIIFGQSVNRVATQDGQAAGDRAAGGRRHRGAGTGFRRAGGDRLFGRKRFASFRFGLVRNHYVGRTFIEPKTIDSHLWRAHQAESGAASDRRTSALC